MKSPKTKSLVLGFISALLLAGVGYAAQSGKNFTGEIMDSACAKSGSHAGMMKADPKMSTAKLCTDGCVAHGAKYVLYDDATKTSYELSDQKKPAAFAGQKVTVMGTLNDQTKTITVADIKAGS